MKHISQDSLANLQGAGQNMCWPQTLQNPDMPPSLTFPTAFLRDPLWSGDPAVRVLSLFFV